MLLVSGKGNIKLCQHTRPLKILQFLLIQEVFVPMPTAEVKYCLTNILSCNREQKLSEKPLLSYGTHVVSKQVSSHTLILLPCSLLDEAHERGDASSGPDHDYRITGFERQAELGSPNIHGNGGLVPIIGHIFILKPVGGHTFEDSSCLGGVLYHHSTDVDRVWMDLKWE